MNDFIFGTLATDALRQEHVRKLRSGITHRHARTPRDPAPGQPITLELTAGPTCPCEQAFVYWALDADPSGQAGTVTHGQVLPMQPAGVEWDMLLWGYVRRFRATLPPQPADTLLRYRLSAVGNGIETFADEGATYAVWVADDPTPDWTHDAVIYQIFVDRFHPGEGRPWLQPDSPAGFYGGTLRGITDHLDHVAELGADVLWLTPIFPSPSHHGYDVTDLLEVEPRLGSKADLRALLDAAHARGMRVLLDFVPNHWSHRHPHFQRALARPDAPEAAWYTFTHWPDEYETFFGVKSMPQLNLRYPAARQHLLDAAAYWLDFGVDGYRLDYAIGPTYDFWADFRRATRTARPDCWTFGEVVEPSDSQLAFEGLLDGCLDFILLEAMRQTFAYSRWEGVRFASFLDRHEAYFPASFSRPSFLDNHDMNRYLWAAGNDLRRLRLAALCQFTLAGPPVIYYGTEVGLSQARDVRQGERGLPEESRLPMLWGAQQDAATFDFYRRLVALRKANPCLRRGSRTSLLAGSDTLAYARSLGGQSLAVALNLADAPRSLLLPGDWNRLLLGTDPALSVRPQEGGTLVELSPLGGVILAGG